MKRITRSENESVAFPQLGLTLRLLEIRDDDIEMGVDAPAGIVLADVGQNTSETQVSGWLPRDVRHDLRNELHAIRVGVDLLRDELLAGKSDEARLTFTEINEALERVERHPSLNPNRTG
jgi:hypothetical protein